MLIIVWTVLLVLFLGKTLGLPVGLMLVSGDSMKPTLNPYDLVVGVKPSFEGGVDVGDIVVVVIPRGDWRTTGIIHRVISLFEDNGVSYVVTRGDNVRFSDPPEPVSRVRYIVVGRIPNYITIPAIGFVLGFLVAYYAMYYPYKRWETGILPPPGSVAAVILVVFALFNAAYIGAVYVDNTPIRFTMPISVSESVAMDLYNSSVIVKLDYANTSLLGVDNCVFLLSGLRFNVKAVLEDSGPPAVIRVPIPEELWSAVWNYTSRNVYTLPSYPAGVEEDFTLRCKVEFREGVLTDSFPLRVVWREPLFLQGSNGTLVIVNRNPVPLNMHIYLLDVNLSKTIFMGNLTVDGSSNLTIRIPGMSRGHLVRVQAFYDFLGKQRFYGGCIHG